MKKAPKPLSLFEVRFDEVVKYNGRRSRETEACSSTVLASSADVAIAKARKASMGEFREWDKSFTCYEGKVVGFQLKEVRLVSEIEIQ